MFELLDYAYLTTFFVTSKGEWHFGIIVAAVKLGILALV